jgi:amidase
VARQLPAALQRQRQPRRVDTVWVHSNGLPLAVQIAGRAGDDAGVLQLSAAIEAARPWAGVWPEIATEGARTYASAQGGAS